MEGDTLSSPGSDDDPDLAMTEYRPPGPVDQTWR